MNYLEIMRLWINSHDPHSRCRTAKAHLTAMRKNPYYHSCHNSHLFPLVLLHSYFFMVINLKRILRSSRPFWLLRWFANILEAYLEVYLFRWIKNMFFKKNVIWKLKFECYILTYLSFYWQKCHFMTLVIGEVFVDIDAKTVIKDFFITTIRITRSFCVILARC